MTNIFSRKTSTLIIKPHIDLKQKSINGAIVFTQTYMKANIFGKKLNTYN